MGDSDSVNAISLSLSHHHGLATYQPGSARSKHSLEAGGSESRKPCSGPLSQRFQKVGLPNLCLTTMKTSTLKRRSEAGDAGEHENLRKGELHCAHDQSRARRLKAVWTNIMHIYAPKWTTRCRNLIQLTLTLCPSLTVNHYISGKASPF